MKTNDLISNLSKNLKPVQPIASTPKNFVFISIFSLLSIFLYVYIKSSMLKYIHIPEFIYEDAIIVFNLLLTLFLLLKESTPGFLIKRKFYFIPIVLQIVWLFSLLMRFILQKDISKELEFVYHDCITDTVFMSLASILLIMVIVNRRIPFRKELISFWIFLVCSSASAVGVSILCPDERSSHLFIFHFLPVLGVSILGIFFGKYIIKDIK